MAYKIKDIESLKNKNPKLYAILLEAERKNKETTTPTKPDQIVNDGPDSQPESEGVSVTEVSHPPSPTRTLVFVPTPNVHARVVFSMMVTVLVTVMSTMVYSFVSYPAKFTGEFYFGVTMILIFSAIVGVVVSAIIGAIVSPLLEKFLSTGGGEWKYLDQGE